MSDVIVFAGKKQAGKNAACNFILLTKLIELGITQHARLNSRGNIEVSDIMGNNIPGLDYFEFKTQPITHDGKTYLIDVDILFDSQLGKEIKIYAFADPLKQLCMDLFGLSYKQCYGTDEDKNSFTIVPWRRMHQLGISESEPVMNEYLTAREVLQCVGTDIFRKLYDTIWVDATIRRVKKDKPKLALISDGRFPDELDGIHAIGGTSIFLPRDPYNNGDSHGSENALKDYKNYSYIIDNSEMTIPEQNKAIFSVMYDIGIPPTIVV